MAPNLPEFSLSENELFINKSMKQGYWEAGQEIRCFCET
jgi:hypothetical protein